MAATCRSHASFWQGSGGPILHPLTSGTYSQVPVDLGHLRSFSILANTYYKSKPVLQHYSFPTKCCFGPVWRRKRQCRGVFFLCNDR